MSGIQSVCVYCGSSNTVDDAYLALADRLGDAIARRGWRLVYGGGDVGLMGRTARAAHKAGGDVLGIMPKFLQQIEGHYEDVPHQIVDTMHERKNLLFSESDAFIVLPGGIGTLEEAVETLSWAKLSLHAKPMAFLSEDEYWAPFFELMDHIIAGGFSPPSMRRLVADAKTPEDALEALEARFIVLD
ncbi:MAG: TIGR00730 family Rossman fold protein [Pseudomonadota bacterium]